MLRKAFPDLRFFLIAHVFVQCSLQFHFLHSIYDLPAIYSNYGVSDTTLYFSELQQFYE